MVIRVCILLIGHFNTAFSKTLFSSYVLYILIVSSPGMSEGGILSCNRSNEVEEIDIEVPTVFGAVTMYFWKVNSYNQRSMLIAVCGFRTIHTL